MAAGVAAALALALTALAAANAAFTHSTRRLRLRHRSRWYLRVSVHWTVHNEIDESEIHPTGNGSIMIIHVVEADALAANGATVPGVPYHCTLHVERDLDGNPVRADATGVQLKLELPNGPLWTAGGVTNVLIEGEHQGSWKIDDLDPVCDVLAG